MSISEPIEIEPKLYHVDSTEGPRVEIVADTHAFTSWPNANVEQFIETAAASEENEARKIHVRNKLEGGLMSLLGLSIAYSSAAELVDGGSRWYLAGIAGGIAATGAGFYFPRNRMTLQTQEDYRRYAAAIRNMPRRFSKR